MPHLLVIDHINLYVLSNYILTGYSLVRRAAPNVVIFSPNNIAIVRLLIKFTCISSYQKGILKQINIRWLGY